MNILFVTPWFPSHSQDKTGKFIFDSIQSLIKRGHHVHVLCTGLYSPLGLKLKAMDESLILHRCQYFSIPRNYCRALSNFFYCIAVTRKIEQLTKRHQYQLVHAHTELAGLAVAHASRSLGIPAVMTLHGIDTDTRLYSKKTQRYRYDDALQGVHNIILVGAPLMEHFKKWTSHHERFHIINNGFWPHETNPVQNELLTREIVQFISVSNLQQGKGVELTLYALAQLVKQGFTRWQYTIIGAGPMRKTLEKLTYQLNLSTKVFFLGFCSPQRVSMQLAQADVFVLPSQPEAFGIAYLEAMACGLLTVAVAGQGPETFIIHEKTGLLIKKYDIHDLVFTLQIILAFPHRMQEIARAGKKYVYENFTWDHHAQRMIELYTNLLNKNKSI